MKIISGGQVGADIAALRTAKELGFETGGWMPKDFRTINGPKPEYAEMYGLIETHDGGYPRRTGFNVKTGDVTLRFAFNFKTYGEKCTAKYIRLHKKPHLDIRIDAADYKTNVSIEYVTDWLLVYQPEIINVAGNAAMEIETTVSRFLFRVFNTFKIYSGAA